jgi:hypothetical protein
MARKRAGRGGYQKPKRPAAVSGVGKDSARTDGGSGSALPIANNQQYGARKQTEALIASSPTSSGAGPAGQPQVQGAPAGGPVQPPRPGLWDPTERPNEPITAGSVEGGNQMATGHYPDMVLEILYKKWPSPWIAGLMDR